MRSKNEAILTFKICVPHRLFGGVRLTAKLTTCHASFRWYRSTLLSRLDDKQRSVLTIVMQRLHVNDLTGYVQASGGFETLSVPAIARADERIALRNGQWHVRRAGDALHPERESLDVLHRMRDQLGEFTFASQYQQSPQTPDGTLFKRKWFRLIDQVPRRRPEGRLILSLDTALSVSPTADFTALSVFIWKTASLPWSRASGGV